MAIMMERRGHGYTKGKGDMNVLREMGDRVILCERGDMAILR